MTDEERISNFHKLFDVKRIASITVNDDLEEDCVDIFGKVYYHHVQYMRMYLDYGDNEIAGINFINSLTNTKLEKAGLKPYDGIIDRDYMASMLRNRGIFDIKLELPPNNHDI